MASVGELGEFGLIRAVTQRLPQAWAVVLGPGDDAAVVSADDVTGPYDVIARAEAADVNQLGQMVVSKVQMIDGITRTLTCTVVHL